MLVMHERSQQGLKHDLQDARVSAWCHRLLEYPPTRRLWVVSLVLFLVEVRGQVHVAPAMPQSQLVMLPHCHASMPHCAGCASMPEEARLGAAACAL